MYNCVLGRSIRTWTWPSTCYCTTACSRWSWERASAWSSSTLFSSRTAWCSCRSRATNIFLNSTTTSPRRDRSHVELSTLRSSSTRPCWSVPWPRTSGPSTSSIPQTTGPRSTSCWPGPPRSAASGSSTSRTPQTNTRSGTGCRRPSRSLSNWATSRTRRTRWSCGLSPSGSRPAAHGSRGLTVRILVRQSARSHLQTKKRQE